MQYKEYKDGIRISRLGMGVMRLPVEDQDDSKIQYEKAKAIIDCCMKSGINYYDTAYIYHGGKSEEFLGRALAEYTRSSFYLADKFNLQANPDYRAQFAQQLERLQMKYIDFYLLHGIQDSFADTMLACGCIAYFDTMKKQGKIKYLGFSYHGSPEKLLEILKAYPWDFVQIQLNYYDWYYGDAKQLYEILAKAQIPVMVMEPVHGGMLANLKEEAGRELKAATPEASLASWAMRWAMDLENVQVVLSGMSDEAQVFDNIDTFEKAVPLTGEEQEKIKTAARIQYSALAVACTGCRYCCPDCPIGLDIPLLLKSYNEAKLGGAWRLNSLKAVVQEKQPAACVGCGSCKEHCPQGFDIPKYMDEMKAMMGSI
ncbi:aldo/keto reductase [Ruminococcus sp. OA3]|uniref:aldo/keto reductase n=1 Tax=Ruminococcus sp. OA3 TaxID=2914164 RepID=UPI001F067F86|nr:aldo/keto reductase [Ruminococcus sp. OA3]MCH1983464.1 aldo/keto reductase [Ruminococcus sp. OA3]